jgi:hypothetical protein
MTQKFELVFVGGSPIQYRRRHQSIDSAETEAARVLAWMTAHEEAPIGASQALNAFYRPSTRADRAAHPAVIYGPDCGAAGRTIR